MAPSQQAQTVNQMLTNHSSPSTISCDHFLRGSKCAFSVMADEVASPPPKAQKRKRNEKKHSLFIGYGDEAKILADDFDVLKKSLHCDSNYKLLKWMIVEMNKAHLVGPILNPVHSRDLESPGILQNFIDPISEPEVQERTKT